MKIINFLLSFVLFLIVFACNDSEDGSSSVNESFNETCSDLSLPAGLSASIDGDVYSSMAPADLLAFMQCASTCGSDMSCMMECMSTNGLSEPGGSFSISITLINATDSGIDYTITPGIWFDPDSEDNQPMMILTTSTITIGANATETKVLPVFCLVLDKDAPDDEDDVYSICESVNSGCIADIVSILEDKNVADMDYSKIEQIQNIVWKCTDGTMGQSDLDILNAL